MLLSPIQESTEPSPNAIGDTVPESPSNSQAGAEIATTNGEVDRYLENLLRATRKGNSEMLEF